MLFLQFTTLVYYVTWILLTFHSNFIKIIMFYCPEYAVEAIFKPFFKNIKIHLTVVYCTTWILLTFCYVHCVCVCVCVYLCVCVCVCELMILHYLLFNNFYLQFQIERAHLASKTKFLLKLYRLSLFHEWFQNIQNL